jgi:hypothetical protein
MQNTSKQVYFVKLSISFPKRFIKFKMSKKKGKLLFVNTNL